ncbi:Alfa-L-rhamnosidase [Candidatus Burkholderia pumila]|uniref:Alfa-L-rhamnosidase n=1 Tax=Candidatus Burkholderia pumila TaxID=1090375 RepID=A0ABR5HLK4_9BURK|nr:Alfa-L-rhamnosidase [Candidatus Burkholderia pumila]
MWENWDGIRPYGTLQDKVMNSFNHYAYGCVGQWMYENVAGIRALRHQARAERTRASCRRPVRVRIRSEMHRSDRDSDAGLSVTVPVNTSAAVWVPHTGGRVTNANDGGRLRRT